MSCRSFNDPYNAHFVGFNHTAVIELCNNPTPRTVSHQSYYGYTTETKLDKADVNNWCEACTGYDPMVPGSVDPSSFHSHFTESVQSARATDWMALLYSSFMIALAAVDEFSDVIFLEYTIASILSDDRFRTRHGWLRALSFLGYVRRFVFIPLLVFAAVWLAVFDGTDAQGVCMNTVALLYLADIDDFAYAVVISEPWQTRMEEAGMVALHGRDVRQLARTKVTHTALVTVAVPLGVAVFGMVDGPWCGCTVVFGAFLIGALEEVRRYGHRNIAPQVVIVVVAWLLGVVVCVTLYFLAKSA